MFRLCKFGKKSEKNAFGLISIWWNIHKIRGAKNQAHTMGANVKLAETMGQTTKVMGQMNKLVDPQKVAKTMHDFEMANAKMEMTEETSK